VLSYLQSTYGSKQQLITCVHQTWKAWSCSLLLCSLLTEIRQNPVATVGTLQGCSKPTALERQDLPCTYLPLFMTIIFSLKSCNAKGDSSCSSYLQKTPGGQPGDLPPPAWQQSAEHAARRAELTSYHICCSASDTGQCPFGQAAAAAGQTLLTSTCTSQWHLI